MSWAQRRKTTYVVSFLSVILMILVAIFFAYFNKKPTCFDGIKNQGEQGIDCGGTCTILCRAQYVDPSVLWTRWSKVLSSGRYNVLAYAQNPNIGVGTFQASYTVKIYDRDNILLFSKSGVTYIPPTPYFTVFEDGINIADKVPARIVFQFGTNFVWQKIENKENGLTTVSKSVVNEDTAPKVLATIKNITLVPIQNIESTAILYDVNDNAIAFSRTITDSIDPGTTADIVFTWPETFSVPVYKVDILSKVLQK
jgi:hypothetical protein